MNALEKPERKKQREREKKTKKEIIDSYECDKCDVILYQRLDTSNAQNLNKPLSPSPIRRYLNDKNIRRFLMAREISWFNDILYFCPFHFISFHSTSYQFVNEWNRCFDCVFFFSVEFVVGVHLSVISAQIHGTCLKRIDCSDVCSETMEMKNKNSERVYSEFGQIENRQLDLQTLYSHLRNITLFIFFFFWMI